MPIYGFRDTDETQVQPPLYCDGARPYDSSVYVPVLQTSTQPQLQLPETDPKPLAVCGLGLAIMAFGMSLGALLYWAYLSL